MRNSIPIELIQIFVQVVKNGSFTKAAQQLRLPKSTVSKALSRLEKETGTPLLIRTTRQQHLTSTGQKFYEACSGPLELIETASKSLSGQDPHVTGNIKLTAPEDLGVQIIAPVVAKLCQKYPGLNFELIYTDKIVDLVKNGFDLAVRIGNLKENSLKAKTIGYLQPVLVAAPSYLKNKPKLTQLEDLIHLDCLSLPPINSTIIWTLKNKQGISRTITVPPRLICNQMSGLLSATLAGGGIALIPSFLCRPYIQDKSLVPLLPHWSCSNLPVSFVSPLPFSSSTRLRIITDELLKEIQKSLQQ